MLKAFPVSVVTRGTSGPDGSRAPWVFCCAAQFLTLIFSSILQGTPRVCLRPRSGAETRAQKCSERKTVSRSKNASRWPDEILTRRQHICCTHFSVAFLRGEYANTSQSGVLMCCNSWDSPKGHCFCAARCSWRLDTGSGGRTQSTCTNARSLLPPGKDPHKAHSNQGSHSFGEQQAGLLVMRHECNACLYWGSVAQKIIIH